MTHLPGDPGALWYDDEAGPMVRPYTVTRGRTGGLPDLDVIALVSPADPAGPAALAPDRLAPLGDEHFALLEQCRAGPVSVAELAAGADLPLGVVRVLLGDLIDHARVRITEPVPPAELPDIGLLNHLISALKSL